MNPASAIPGAHDTVDEAASWIERLARLGFLAKALLYITVGALATAAAVGMGGNATPGRQDALLTVFRAPLGRVLVGIIALGLFGYALWRFVEAIFDPEGKGDGVKGIALRVKSAVTGAIHFAIGIPALQLALGQYASSRDGEQAQQWTARALSAPGGTIALWLAALGLAAYGAWQLWRGARAKLDRRLALGGLKPRTARIVIATSRFGIAARGVVFIAMGGLVGRAVQQHDPSEAGGTQQSLRELVRTLGPTPFALVAVGLIAYGVYEILNARYRRIRVA